MTFLGRWFSDALRLALSLAGALLLMQAPALSHDYEAALRQVADAQARDIASRERPRALTTIYHPPHPRPRRGEYDGKAGKALTCGSRHLRAVRPRQAEIRHQRVDIVGFVDQRERVVSPSRLYDGEACAPELLSHHHQGQPLILNEEDTLRRQRHTTSSSGYDCDVASGRQNDATT